MATQATRFPGSTGQMLAASLEMPVVPVRAVALFAHCFTCTRQSKAATRIAAALAGEGIATMRFDFTGLGGSEGDFANAGFAGDVADLVAAARHLERTVGAPAVLVGHSLGGAAVLAAAADIPSARAVVTIGAPFDPAHVLHNIDGDLDAIERDGEGAVTIGGRAFRMGRGFLEATRGGDPAARIARLGRALLVLHAPVDTLVGIENARAIFEAARHPKSFVSLDSADHLLTRASDAEYAARLIAGWAERYLPPGGEGPQIAPGQVYAGNANSKWGTAIRARHHHWFADEPREVGGEDAGPGPYDLLLAALGACTAMTLRYYAGREGLPLEHAEVRLTHDRNHADDCAHVLEPGTRIEAIRRSVRLTGAALTAEQRAKLMQIADRCPVHRTLTGHLHIHTVGED